MIAAGKMREADALIGAVLEAWARHPQADVVREGADAVSAADLLARAGSLAAALRAQGVGCDDIVAIRAGRSAATFAQWLAVMLLGAACMPLDAAYPAARLAMMVEDARPRLLLAERAAWDALPAPAGMLRCDPATLPATDDVPDVQAGTLAYVLFTSGSSGRPKGVAMRRAVLAHLVAWHRAHPRLGRPARTLQFAPLSFDVSFQEVWSTWATGGTLVLPTEDERRDPFALLELLARAGVERLFLPYVALQALAEAFVAGGTLPAALRDVVTAGEALRVTPALRALFAALPGCVLHNHYGPTETHVVTAWELSGDPAAWPDLPPIGRALPYVEVRVVAPGTCVDVAPGAEGELLLGGDCLAAGYIHRPELTAERFVSDRGGRWYRTGDAAHMDADGVLTCHGRLDDQLKIDGFRVEPGEIEAVLGRDPRVAEAVVVAGGGSRLVAHVVPREETVDGEALAADLLGACRAGLAAYLVPHEILVVPGLPLTASGKIDRRRLADMAREPAWEWPEAEPPERQLLLLWRHVLGSDVLAVDDNVFDAGARSLGVVRVLTALRQRGHRALTAAAIYEQPSVRAQARLLAGTDVAAASPAVAADTHSRGERQRAALGRFARQAGGRK